MEKIILKFSVQHSFDLLSKLVVTLTMDDEGKQYIVKREGMLNIRHFPESEGPTQNLPKRIMTAFTESAIDKILSKDEIPNESGMMVLDGCNYEIAITKGNTTKVYSADDVSVETYSLLRYLASWCRKQ